jgi:hypothetical protein
MRFRLAVALLVLGLDAAFAQDASQYDPARYPDWSGQLQRPGTGPNRYDPAKPPGRAQEAPLTAEYQAIMEAGLADQAAGGQGNNYQATCVPAGMPRIMAGNIGIEFIVTPKVTHVVFMNGMPRRIYTDGRSFREYEEPAFHGYSIGKWSDADGDGRFDTLEVETRHFNGPRTFDNSGTPLHADNQTIVKERIYRDKADRDLMHNEMTTIDNALTRPWSVHKTYRSQKEPTWVENICNVRNQLIGVGKDVYFLSADGLLMPTKKGQKPPDTRYFEQGAR